MPQHLLIRLSSPLIAFGGETIDNFGVIRDFPALSMVTGLIANALGWDRGDDVLHNDLQARLRVGSRIERVKSKICDYQTAELFEDDGGWTTCGVPEGRAKSPSYTANGDGRKALTLQRYRDYHADLVALVALRLVPAVGCPTLLDIAQALDRPKRPLFIGRKPCLPTHRLVVGHVEADNILGALLQAPSPTDAIQLRAQWPDGEGTLTGDRTLDVCDERNWTSGLHGGWRPVREGFINTAGAQP